MKIKVIANHPQKGQDSIKHLIGKVYDVINFDKESNEVQVESKEFDGTDGIIILNKREWKRVVDKRKKV